MTNVKGPIISFTNLPSIDAYLSAHEGSQSGFWLKLAKAGAPEATITKAQAIEAALCHGWIDGQLRAFDKHYFLVRMTPRRNASRWSAINRDTAEPSCSRRAHATCGLSEVQKAKAKADGRWSVAYQSQGKAEPPSDFLAALAANVEAERAFATLDRANKYLLRLSRERCQAPRNTEQANSRVCRNARPRRKPFIQPKANGLQGPDRAAERRINVLRWLAQVRFGSNAAGWVQSRRGKRPATI